MGEEGERCTMLFEQAAMVLVREMPVANDEEPTCDE